MTQPPEPPPPPGTPPNQPYGQAPPPPAYQPYGAPYQPSPYQQKSSGGKTALIVILVIVLVILLVCGGIIGFFVWAVSKAENSLDEFDSDRPGGPDNPLTVAEGEAFTIDGMDYEKGWKLAPSSDYPSGTITALKVLNDREDESAENVNIYFTFLSEKEEVGEVNCYSDGSIRYDHAETLTCYGFTAAPAAWDEIEVHASY